MQGGIILINRDVLKLIILELLVVAFIKYQILDEETSLVLKGENDENTDETKKEKAQNIDIFDLIIKSKDFAGSIKPYLNKKEQYYVDMFTKIAEITEIQKNLMSVSEEDIESMDEKEIDHIGILKAVKPYMADDKKEIIDKFLKFYEAVTNVHEKMDKYTMDQYKNASIFDKIADLYDAIQPVIPEEKKDVAEKVVKNIKLLEALNKAEGIMSSMKDSERKQNVSNNKLEKNDITRNNENVNEENILKDDKEDVLKNTENKEEIEVQENTEKEISNKDKEEKGQEDNLGLSGQQAAMLESLKSMLTKEQQQYMYNMINYIKNQGSANKEEKK